MSAEGCPFCSIKDCDTIEIGRSWKLILSKPKESMGHTIFVSKRHVATWFDLQFYEQSELNFLLDKRRFEMDKVYSPDGYNINISCGEVAGQEIPHCHVHLIPRYSRFTF